MFPTKSKIMKRLFVFGVAVLVIASQRPLLAADGGGGEMPTKTAFSYRLTSGDTRETARALALYGAKYRAVHSSAKELSKKGLLMDDAHRHPEIYCLVADGIEYSVVDQSFLPDDGVYYVEIKSRVGLADFVKAEIKDAELEKEEEAFSLQEEMEAGLSKTLEPGLELSRAYRYIRKQHWRMAIIYLDHLEKKYPGWGDLFYAKGLGFEGENETDQAKDAFSRACERDYQPGCLKAGSAKEN